MARTTSKQKSVRKKLHSAAAKAKKGVLIGLCQQIEEETCASDSDHIPYGMVQEIVKDLKETFPWLSRDKLNNALRAQRVHPSRESSAA